MFFTSHVPLDINVIHSFIVNYDYILQLTIIDPTVCIIIVLRVIPGILIMLFITLNVLLGDTE